MQQVRVRFAPSPTGPLHIGGLRTALYNYLFAKKNHGTFVLRIEDTDRQRFVEGALEFILESLEWAGIKPDEGIIQGGKFGPYQQSLRKDIYQEHIQRLIMNGSAYYAFDTPEELEKMREDLKSAGSDVQLYNFLTRDKMSNSLNMSSEEVQQKLTSKEDYVVRLKVPENENIEFFDIVRGSVEINSANIDDKVLMKSDGMPTYHLANVVDDHLMEISHVIRGEEWLSSTPLHVLLYHSFGWESSMPKFAHLPLLLKPDGKGKLSKRDADKQGFPIFPLSWKDPVTGEVSEGYKQRGFLPGALVNFLAFLGWNPGTEQELFSMKELYETFTLERVHKGGSKFDYEKAKWFNQQYLKKEPIQNICEQLKNTLTENGVQFREKQIEKAVKLMIERVSFPKEIFTNAQYLWIQPDNYDEKVISKKWNDQSRKAITAIANHWQSQNDFSEEAIRMRIDSVTIQVGNIMQILRVALTGSPTGLDLMQIISFLGKDETVARLNKALTILN